MKFTHTVIYVYIKKLQLKMHPETTLLCSVKADFPNFRVKILRKKRNFSNRLKFRVNSTELADKFVSFPHRLV